MSERASASLLRASHRACAAGRDRRQSSAPPAPSDATVTVFAASSGAPGETDTTHETREKREKPSERGWCLGGPWLGWAWSDGIVATFVGGAQTNLFHPAIS